MSQQSQPSTSSSSGSSRDRTGPDPDRGSDAPESESSASWGAFDPTGWLGNRWNLQPRQEELLRRVYRLPGGGGGGVPLDREELLRCREEALRSASYMAPELTAFIEEDAENVVALAKRFERYLRDGV